MERPDVLVGTTRKIKIDFPDGKNLSFYVTVNRDVDGNPIEVFANVKDAQFWEHLSLVTVLISRLLQTGTPAKVLAQELKQIRSPGTRHFAGGEDMPSLYAHIGSMLEDKA